MSSRTKERRRLSIRYFDDRILLTDTHAWPTTASPTVPYEFTTAEEREALATNITIAPVRRRAASRMKPIGGEIAKWTEQAERLGRALESSALVVRHASSDEIAWLYRHTLLGPVGDPPPSAARRRTWGAGEIEGLFEGQVHNS